MAVASQGHREWLAAAALLCHLRILLTQVLTDFVGTHVGIDDTLYGASLWSTHAIVGRNATLCVVHRRRRGSEFAHLLFEVGYLLLQFGYLLVALLDALVTLCDSGKVLGVFLRLGFELLLKVSNLAVLIGNHVLCCVESLLRLSEVVVFFLAGVASIAIGIVLWLLLWIIIGGLLRVVVRIVIRLLLWVFLVFLLVRVASVTIGVVLVFFLVRVASVTIGVVLVFFLVWVASVTVLTIPV